MLIYLHYAKLQVIRFVCGLTALSGHRSSAAADLMNPTHVMIDPYHELRPRWSLINTNDGSSSLLRLLYQTFTYLFIFVSCLACDWSLSNHLSRTTIVTASTCESDVQLTEDYDLVIRVGPGLWPGARHMSARLIRDNTDQTAASGMSRLMYLISL